MVMQGAGHAAYQVVALDEGVFAGDGLLDLDDHLRGLEHAGMRRAHAGAGGDILAVGEARALTYGNVTAIMAGVSGWHVCR